MIRKIVNQAILVLITVGLWFASLRYTELAVRNLFYSVLSLSVIYFVFKLILEEMFSERIKNKKNRYSFRKIVSTLYVVVFLRILFRIWIENPQALLVTYGILGAGIVISLQDFFKSFLGGLMIIGYRIYTVGDRVELDDRIGDVIDIGVLSTTLLEIQEWVDGEQPTGRVITVPNKTILSDSIINYTKDNNFLWDEIKIPITYDSDWKKAIRMIRKITKDETVSMGEKASKELEGLQKRYYLSDKDVFPSVYIKMNDNWIETYVRYITDARTRREVHDKINRRILEAISEDEDVAIASETLDVTSFPELDFGPKVTDLDDGR